MNDYTMAFDVQTSKSVVIDTRNIEQGTDLWKRVRLGHVTASNVADVMAKGKGESESITRHKYKMRLLAERIVTDPSFESFTSPAMEWGIEQEQFACIAYEEQKNVLVERTGFWLHPTIKWLGVSPDRLVGDDGLIEVKCPNSTTHLDYLMTNKVPAEYVKQIQCQLWVTGRQWCDFVSYDSRLRRHNQLLIVRAERNEELIAEMEVEVKKFLAEIELLIIKLGE
jgi:putative phage-type endonuclease